MREHWRNLSLGAAGGLVYVWIVMIDNSGVFRSYLDHLSSVWQFWLFPLILPLIAGILSVPLRSIRWGLVSFAVTVSLIQGFFAYAIFLAPWHF